VPWKTKSFKQLQDEWYDRLAKSGFEDIETRAGKLRPLHKGNIENKLIGREAYYRQLEEMLRTRPPRTKRYRKVLRLLCKGASIREAAAKINRHPRSVGRWLKGYIKKQ